MTYQTEATIAAVQMWGKGMSTHAIRAALETQHPRPDGWALNDVHAAIGQRTREVEAWRGIGS